MRAMALCMGGVCRSFLETRAYSPVRSIFFGLRDWPTLFDFDSGTVRLAGISAVYPKLVRIYGCRPDQPTPTRASVWR